MPYGGVRNTTRYFGGNGRVDRLSLKILTSLCSCVLKPFHATGCFFSLVGQKKSIVVASPRGVPARLKGLATLPCHSLICGG